MADGSVHPMTTDEVGRGRSHTHSFRVGADYNIAKNHQLSFVYNGGYSTSHNWKGVTGTQVSIRFQGSVYSRLMQLPRYARALS